MLAFKRGKNRYVADFKVRDIYKTYKGNVNKPVSQLTFHNILKDLNCEKVVRMVAESKELYFPFRLGSMRLRKKKKKLVLKQDGTLDKTKMPVKWKETKKMWSEKYPDKTPEEIANIPIEEKGLIYNWNEHTDRCEFNFYWDKFTSNVPNRAIYTFKAVRNARQLVTRLLKDSPELQYKYFE